MSFVRSSRVRFFICVALVIFGFGLLWNNTQQQLENQQQQNLLLNERIQSMVEQKLSLEKNLEYELRNIETKHKDKETKDKQESEKRYEKLEEIYKKLRGQHENFVADCETTKKQRQTDVHNLEAKLQSLRGEYDAELNAKADEINVWKDKYELLRKEQDRLELLLDAKNSNDFQKEIDLLKASLSSCQDGNDQKLVRPELISKPQTAEHTKDSTGDGGGGVPRPQAHIEKSFSSQNTVSPGIYHLALQLTNATDESPPVAAAEQPSLPTNNENATVREASKSSETGVWGKQKGYTNSGAPNTLYATHRNNSLILNSVENFQIVPKSLKNGSKEKPGGDQIVGGASTHALSKNNGATLVPNNTASTKPESGYVAMDLRSPASLRKLPANVAPIPDMSINDAVKGKEKNADHFPVVPKVDDGTLRKGNDKYGNMGNDLSHKKDDDLKAALENENSDANDNDVIGDRNFFEHDKHVDKSRNEERDQVKMNDNEDEDLMGGEGGKAAVGDIEVKNQNLLDADNLNNEVAGDQGKEFADGLRIEDGNDEDEDEDDYSNLAARQQGEQAIRH